MPLGERARGRLRYGLDNPFTRNIDPTLVLDLPFSEGVGNTVHDRSLYGNHGSIYGPTWVDGKIGKGLNFDALGDYVLVADASSIRNLSEFTFLAWIYPESWGQVGLGRIFDKADSILGFLYQYTFTIIKRYTITEATARSIGGTIVFNSWQHVALAMLNNVPYLYHNGVEVTYLYRTNGVGDSPDDTGDLYIGNRAALNRTFDGVIDEVRFCNRLLSEAEILRLYNEGK